MVDPDLESVIQSAINGNRESFTVIVQRFHTFAYRLAYGFLNDRMEAEDAVQESFAKAYFSIHKLQSAFAFHSWFSRILTNICMERMKKKHNRIQVEDIENLAIADTAIDQEMKNLVSRITLQEALDKLSAEHRTVLVLKEVHGFDYSEIAEILSIPLGTVKSRLHSSRMQLRNQLLNQAEGEGK